MMGSDRHRVSKMRKSKTYNIRINEEAGCAAVSGPIKPFAHLIASFNLDFALDNAGHLQSNWTHRPFFERDVLDRVWVYSALVPAIITALRAQGHDPEIIYVGNPAKRFGAAESVMARLQAP